MAVLIGVALLIWVIYPFVEKGHSAYDNALWAIAPAVAIFGIFGWTGGTSNAFCRCLRESLKKIGLAYTAGALALTGMAFLRPIIDAAEIDSPEYWIFATPFVLLGLLAIAPIAAGTYYLILNIHPLWQFREESKLCPICS